MKQAPTPVDSLRLRAARWLTFLMFMIFAIATDSVGVIIPQVVREFGLSMTAAGSFHYASMIAIGLSGVLLGHWADRFGRKATILAGLSLFALASFLFVLGERFSFFLLLIATSGVAIGVFKTGALALIGDLSGSARQHTTTMNAAEGFFGVGAIIGPAIVAYLLARGYSWKWLYVFVGALCVLLILLALFARYPSHHRTADRAFDLRGTLRMARDRHALAFSALAFLYVAVECAIYVWMPTLLADYDGPRQLIATYAISIFFTLRAAGRFLGSWLLGRFSWSAVIALCSAAVFACFAASLILGVEASVVLLPASGVFMSVLYPTINSKGISCFAKAQHGAIAGIILFFTAAGAALGPLAMAALADVYGHVRYGFMLATVLAGLLFAALLFNWARDPAGARLRSTESQDRVESSKPVPAQP